MALCTWNADRRRKARSKNDPKTGKCARKWRPSPAEIARTCVSAWRKRNGCNREIMTKHNILLLRFYRDREKTGTTGATTEVYGVIYLANCVVN